MRARKACSLVVCVLLFACSGGSVDDSGSWAPGGGGISVAQGGYGTGQSGNSGLSFGGSTGLGFGGATAPGGVGGNSCAVESAGAEVLPVYLAFAFDVSGSMGSGDQPWYDQKLKWDPVAAATKGFFAEPASKGLAASLTFFPTKDQNGRCSSSSYDVPDVPMTPLPSPVFGTALDKVPARGWQGGTPTLAVLKGVASGVKKAMQATPGHYVIVLVTDGYPEGCNDDRIASVASAASGLLPDVRTYVIGIANPPIKGAPDTVSNLNQIAVAGGTERAFLIDTGNPAQTSTAFREAVNSIRGGSVACEAVIPPAPSGKVFDKRRVAVSQTVNGATSSLVYDEACAANDAWHYDNATTPKRVVLCPSACSRLQADSNAKLTVQFACEDLILPPL